MYKHGEIFSGRGCWYNLRQVFAVLAAICFVLICGDGPVASAEADVYKSDTSIQGLIGIWYEADVLDSRTLTVKPDYTYELAYKGGGTAFGTVGVTAEEHPDGSKSYWYMFYESDGKFWAGFAKNDDGSVQNELWSGQDGAMHFVRSLNNKYGSAESVAAKDYLGVWSVGRINAVIEKKDSDYIATVKWSTSAAQQTIWTYPCRYDANQAILTCNGMGSCVEAVYSEDGTYQAKLVYEDGSCDFVLRNGVLTWYDKKQGAGSEVELRR